MIRATGGYFGLELPRGAHYHKDALRLNTARNCLEYIVTAKRYQKVYIPYFTCESVLEPLERNRIDHEFYRIDDSLEPVDTFALPAGHAFLYTNYFGLKNDAVARLAKRYGKQLIADNAQAFYAPPLKGIDTFYSPRKFFGVADGAYLYTDTPLKEDLERDVSFDRMVHLLKRIDCSAEAAYADFQKNENLLDNEPVKVMSHLTEHILQGIDYEKARNIRRENSRILDSALRKHNLLPIDFPDDGDTVPMVYPFWGKGRTLREKLIAEKIYVAAYWNNVFAWCRENDREYVLAKSIIPLPVDQRYGKEEMQKMIKIITFECS